MKKFLSYALLLAVIGLVACKPNTDADKVAEKIENNETLTIDDYEVMFDYVEEAVVAIEKVIEDSNGDVSVVKKSEEKLKTEFPHAEAFIKQFPWAKPLKHKTDDERHQLRGKIFAISLMLARD